MKRILTTAFAIVLFVGASQAQTTDDAGRRHGKHGEAMKELQLTEDQKARLKTIREAERKEMEALKADGKTEAGKAARKQVHEKYRAQTEAVLTPEQKAKWQDGPKDMRGKKDGTLRGGRMDQLGKDLNLTDDQKGKVASLNTEFKGKMDALRSNGSLSEEQRKTQARQLGGEHQAKLKALLTQEQVAKLEAKRKHHKPGRVGNTNL